MTCHHVLPCQCHVLLYRIVICKLHSSQSPSVCLYSEADLDQDKKLRFRSSLSVSSLRGFFNLITASTSRSRGSIMAMSPPRSDHVIVADMRGGCIARSYSLDIAMISNCWPSWGPIRIVILSVIQPGSSIIIPCHCVRCQVSARAIIMDDDIIQTINTRIIHLTASYVVRATSCKPPSCYHVIEERSK